MRNTKPQPGKEKILIPGDPEREAYKIRLISGVPVNKEVVKSLEDISGVYGHKIKQDVKSTGSLKN
jgi:LDH2 family malate/lactate/ureidoglycolate dehydrogenase